MGGGVTEEERALQTAIAKRDAHVNTLKTVSTTGFSLNLAARINSGI